MEATRVERHKIKSTHPYYCLLDNLCFRTKNLYNSANYLIRRNYIATKSIYSYDNLYSLVKTSPEYNAMPLFQCAERCLRKLLTNWYSFQRANKDYKYHPEKYNGQPHLPKYLDKNGRCVFSLTVRHLLLQGDGTILFPSVFEGFTLQTKATGPLMYIEFIPRFHHIVVEVCYKKTINRKQINNGRYLSIDLGVDNFAAVVNNVGLPPYVIDGKYLKSINQYYNKELAHYKEIAMRMNQKYSTNRLQALHVKRQARFNDYLHKASRYIVDYASKNNICAIIIGNNKHWKQHSNLGKRINQTFCEIPHEQFIQMLSYKCEDLGIHCFLTEETFTSSTSFLDGEYPCRQYYNPRRRITRGLFQTNSGVLINADVNAAYQILKKVIPNAVYANGIEGVGFHPIRVSLVS